MKTSIKVAALAALALAAFTFDSCKKGENDPFLSLHTRKARVAGDWTVKSGSGSSTSGNSTTTWTYDGATYTETSGSNTTSNSVTMTMSFDKKGTYKSVTTRTGSGYSDVTTESGTWNFTAGVGDDKNKDHIVLRTLSSSDALTINSTTTTSTDTYTGDDAPSMIYYIDELKNKEMVFKWKGTTGNGSSTSSDDGSYTLEQ